ncbi:MAG: translation initiation factor IF-3, partial [Chloroflexi bacterium]|nr:translation initiation factor IF-3 [Chloroflexota bacterium]
KERESRKQQKNVELREVRMRPRIDQHDIAYKSKRIREFLDEGHKVKLSVLFRGREITHPELAIGLLRRVAESLAESAKLEKAPALEGRMMTMILAPLPGGSKRPGGDGKAETAAPAKTQEKTSAKA